MGKQEIGPREQQLRDMRESRAAGESAKNKRLAAALERIVTIPVKKPPKRKKAKL